MIKYIFFGDAVSTNTYISAERTNRYRAAKIKKTETETIALEIKSQKAEPIKYKIDVHFKIYAKDKKRDPDSWSFFIKTFFDGMQEAGIIPNDSQNFIGAISQDSIYIDKLNPRIEVFIKKSIDKCI